MQLNDLLKKLGYADSPNFLQGRKLGRDDYYGHIFRRAHGNPCCLRGVYALRDSPGTTSPIVPVVYVCAAKSDAEVDTIHKLVWNQDVVPFLLVHTPTCVRLYSGFRYRHREQAQARGLLKVLENFNQVHDLARGFYAESIDEGRLWREWGHEVTPERRVDWELLSNLRQLDEWLQRTGGLRPEVSHGLIGKYVYLHYLRDRDILSERKLAGWNLSKQDVFGRDATLKGFRTVVGCLNEWLNGSIFPLELNGKDTFHKEHLSRVAGTFAGDQPQGDDQWQLHLDFERYNFSYIPIETLSVIYEQFLHAPDETGKKTRGREAGAYYTPLPVVNFMLAEMEERKPLEPGMRVFDPSCGSGAFLVQCYRRLIEKQFRPGGRKSPRPRELRELLEKSIFGVDRDPDACSVTELSLTLTLLDYVDPPDLENDHRVKLPALRGQNIFCSDFFNEQTPWHAKLSRSRCDWIVGNPPWKPLSPRKLREQDRPAWDWIATNARRMPVGGNQVARAFAWKAGDYLTPSGCMCLLLPARTLFSHRFRAFRAAFFRGMRVYAVANFANLTEVLFARRSREPASAFLWGLRPADSLEPSEEECIAVNSPLVANQETTRPAERGKRTETWSLVVNGGEVRHIRVGSVLPGSGLPWKLAAWGSHLDWHLLDKLRRWLPSLEDLERDGTLAVAEGPALVEKAVAEGPNKTEFVEEVIGKKALNTAALMKLRHLFRLPERALLQNQRFHLHLRRGGRGLAICRPPHIIVSEARSFAVYADEYLIVPPRQIGIASPTGDRSLLIAMSLYLSSDFFFYHQFLTSTEFGVKRDVATLEALRGAPVPLDAMRRNGFRDWTVLHSQLVRTKPRSLEHESESTPQLPFAESAGDDQPRLLAELNDMVGDALGLDDRDRALVHDLVHVRLRLTDGKLGRAAVDPPTEPQMHAYAKRLKGELDAFVEGELPKRHEVAVVFDKLSGMVQVDLIADLKAARKLTVARADTQTAAELEKTRGRLRKERSQWVYFDRNLRIYEKTRTYILKPMQRFHWTESQAMFDAGEIIAETLAGPGDRG